MFLHKSVYNGFKCSYLNIKLCIMFEHEVIMNIYLKRNCTRMVKYVVIHNVYAMHMNVRRVWRNSECFSNKFTKKLACHDFQNVVFMLILLHLWRPYFALLSTEVK